MTIFFLRHLYLYSFHHLSSTFSPHPFHLFLVIALFAFCTIFFSFSFSSHISSIALSFPLPFLRHLPIHVYPYFLLHLSLCFPSLHIYHQLLGHSLFHSFTIFLFTFIPIFFSTFLSIFFRRLFPHL